MPSTAPLPKFYTAHVHGIGRILIAFGLLVVVAGVCVLMAERFHFPIGRLPGDIQWRGKNSAFYFPLTSCLLVSALLSLLFYILSRLRR